MRVDAPFLPPTGQRATGTSGVPPGDAGDAGAELEAGSALEAAELEAAELEAAMNPGYFTAAASAVFNGCFAVIFKQYAKEVHPLAFTSFFSVGFLALFVLSIAIDSQDRILTNMEDTDVLPMFCPCKLASVGQCSLGS